MRDPTLNAINELLYAVGSEFLYRAFNWARGRDEAGRCGDKSDQRLPPGHLLHLLADQTIAWKIQLRQAGSPAASMDHAILQFPGSPGRLQLRRSMIRVVGCRAVGMRSLPVGTFHDNPAYAAVIELGSHNTQTTNRKHGTCMMLYF